MKTIVSFLIGFFVVLAMAIPAKAQYNSRGGYGRRPLPGGWGGGGYGYGYDPRMMDPCFEAQQYYEGIRGNFHFAKTKVKLVNGKKVEVVEKHFHACDPTNHPVRGRETAGWAGAGGAVIGGVLGGWKGAGVGAVTGVGLGILMGDDHKDCLPIESNHPELSFGGLQANQVSPIAMTQSSTPSQEQGTSQPVAGPAANHDESHGPAYRSGNRPVVNSTRKNVELYDGDRKDENFVGEMAPGDSWDLAKPQKRYRAFAQIPNRRGSDSIDEIEPEPTDTGWIFVEPTVARGR